MARRLCVGGGRPVNARSWYVLGNFISYTIASGRRSAYSAHARDAGARWYHIQYRRRSHVPNVSALDELSARADSLTGLWNGLPFGHPAKSMSASFHSE